MRQFIRFYRWGNNRQDLGPFLRFLILVGLVCVVVGVAASVPIIWVAGLLVIFFMVPLVYLREKMRYWIQDRIRKDRERE